MLDFLSFFGFRSQPDDSITASPSTADGAEETVVIIGGGVIGLSTAYNLAIKNQNAKPPVKQRVIVLEAGATVFSAASANNTGCIHYGFWREPFGDDITELGKYSFELWQSIAQNDPEFQTTGYRSDSFLPIYAGSGQAGKDLPNWMANGSQWDIKWGDRGDPCAVVNPAGVAEWLENQCRKMGVEIRTTTTVVGAILSKKNTIEGLECSPRETGEKYVLPCQNLVISAGPWTPSLVKSIFPASILDLHPSTNVGDWVVLENKNALDARTRSVVFMNEIVQEKLEFAGRDDGSIWVCGRRSHTGELPSPNVTAEPDSAVISDLMDYSNRFLHLGQEGQKEGTPNLSILATGRSFRPSTVSGLPFISEIPSHLLLPSEGAHSTSSGVFVCYGHGSYGMSLGMGSGKLMAQLMHNEKTDIDISKFRVIH